MRSTAARLSQLAGPRARRLSTLPSHLQGFYTPAKPTTCMIVGNPFFKYALAMAKPTPEVAPLIEAIRELPDEKRPFRILSHDSEDGRVRHRAA